MKITIAVGSAVAIPLAVVLAACSSGAAPIHSTAPSSTADTATHFSVPSDIPSDIPSATSPSFAESTTRVAAAYPPGYPKIVSVSSLPVQVQDWYKFGNYTQAVAVAPGVWTPLPPGVSVQDAAPPEGPVGSLEGFCASVKTYERVYTPGEEHGGACW